MLEAALSLEGAARRLNLNELNAALRAATPAQAPEITRLLDSAILGELEDQSGHCCRAVAVEALLRFGFPWAMHVTPEDLAFARARYRQGWDDGNRISAIAVVTVAGGLGLLGLM